MRNDIYPRLGTVSFLLLISGRGVLITTWSRNYYNTYSQLISEHCQPSARKNMFNMICAFVGLFLLLRSISPVSADEFADEDENRGYVVSRFLPHI